MESDAIRLTIKLLEPQQQPLVVEPARQHASAEDQDFWILACPLLDCQREHQELKMGFAREQIPTGPFHANALYFAMGVLAYNLAQLLQRRLLPESYRAVASTSA